jgi:hypothetical protein
VRDSEFCSLANALFAGILIMGIATVTFDLLSFSVATGLTFVMIGAAGALLRLRRTGFVQVGRVGPAPAAWPARAQA